VAERAAPDVSWQGSLFATPAVAGPLSFAALERHDLGDRSWIDRVPAWVPDHGDLFDWLLEHAPWQQRTRRMWDATVLEPRLVASWGAGEAVPGRIAELVAPLDERYGVRFDSCLVNLYRDGTDAVAWHADTVRKVLRDPLVATISLGVRRPFLVRSAAGGPVVRRYAPGEGDLLVMGGACQHAFVHTVPRVRSVCGARMSITLRHSRPRRLTPYPRPSCAAPSSRRSSSPSPSSPPAWPCAPRPPPPERPWPGDPPARHRCSRSAGARRPGHAGGRAALREGLGALAGQVAPPSCLLVSEGGGCCTRRRPARR
jgi:alkylated DNA repair dioxygenase AlkB